MKADLPYISVEITSQCNLNCVYCYNPWKRAGEELPAEPGYKKAKKLLRHLFKIAEVKHVTFTGGEPFLAERFAETVLYTRLKKKTVTLISNGTAAGEDDYKMMIRLGVALFEFPLHSINPEVHDRMVMKKGSWEKSHAAMLTVKNNGGTVVPVIVITTLNIADLVPTLEYLDSLGFRRIMLNRYNIGGTSLSTYKEILPAIDELRKAFTLANETAERLNLAVTSNVCTPFCVLNPKDYPKIGFGSCSPEVTEKPLTIDLDGNIRLCNHSPVIAGNIFKTPLNDILYSDYANSWACTTPVFCKGCSLFEKCLGGCRAASEQMGFGLDTVDPCVDPEKVKNPSLKFQDPSPKTP